MIKFALPSLTFIVLRHEIRGLDSILTAFLKTTKTKLIAAGTAGSGSRWNIPHSHREMRPHLLHQFLSSHCCACVMCVYNVRLRFHPACSGSCSFHWLGFFKTASINEIQSDLQFEMCIFMY